MSSAARVREALKQALDEAEWGWLAPHLERQALILVSQDLELLEVAEKVTIDSVESVHGWIAEGKLAKPTPTQIETWNANAGKRFITLIVRPYVLIQEKPN